MSLLGGLLSGIGAAGMQGLEWDRESEKSAADQAFKLRLQQLTHENATKRSQEQMGRQISLENIKAENTQEKHNAIRETLPPGWILGANGTPVNTNTTPRDQQVVMVKWEDADGNSGEIPHFIVNGKLVPAQGAQGGAAPGAAPGSAPSAAPGRKSTIAEATAVLKRQGMSDEDIKKQVDIWGRRGQLSDWKSDDVGVFGLMGEVGGAVIDAVADAGQDAATQLLDRNMAPANTLPFYAASPGLMSGEIPRSDSSPAEPVSDKKSGKISRRKAKGVEAQLEPGGPVSKMSLAQLKLWQVQNYAELVKLGRFGDVQEMIEKKTVRPGGF